LEGEEDLAGSMSDWWMKMGTKVELSRSFRVGDDDDDDDDDDDGDDDDDDDDGDGDGDDGDDDGDDMAVEGRQVEERLRAPLCR
jgi:hypothetical protein